MLVEVTFCVMHTTCMAALQVMYSYYACSCVGIRWSKPLARNITTLQLTQMFVNLALLSSICYTCGPKHHVSFWPTAAMYTCYACLFMDLYRQRYSSKRKEQSGVPQHTEGGLHAAPVYPPGHLYIGAPGHLYIVAP